MPYLNFCLFTFIFNNNLFANPKYINNAPKIIPKQLYIRSSGLKVLSGIKSCEISLIEAKANPTKSEKIKILPGVLNSESAFHKRKRIIRTA